LVTEEDLEEIYKEEIQSEIEKITVQCNVFVTECYMETDFGEAILCNLCEESITMKEARHLGAIKIEKQAKKMLQVK
jgi:hypothetical protein